MYASEESNEKTGRGREDSFFCVAPVVFGVSELCGSVQPSKCVFVRDALTTQCTD